MSFEFLDYTLPESLIAQHPAARRDEARLLVLERATGALHDTTVAAIGEWLRSPDVLVLNETRVIPARLYTRRPTGGRVELLFVRPLVHDDQGARWRVLARPARGARPGVVLSSEGGGVRLEVTGAGESGERDVRAVSGDLDATLRAEGEIPLPPYIDHAAGPDDRERYQTVYARVDGAVAAPTAGLHFTPGLLADLSARGVESARVLLHVGPGTFRPLDEGDPRNHRMDEEWFDVPESAADTLVRSRAAGGRIFAVGTTSVRALESACDVAGGTIAAAQGWTRKFIHPPYRFQAVDALLTNFHLPRTSLLLLVAAFAGAAGLQNAYQHAIARGYRFYSYGDAMLIV